MLKDTTVSRIRLLFNSIGLSCLGGAIFIQVLVFTNILQQGYFRAIENNSTILTVELALTAFTVVYFIYFYQREIRGFLKR